MMATTARTLSRTACDGRAGTVALGVRDERRRSKQHKYANPAGTHTLFLNVADDLDGRKFSAVFRDRETIAIVVATFSLCYVAVIQSPRNIYSYVGHRQEEGMNSTTETRAVR
jgi:hypothetical protein